MVAQQDIYTHNLPWDRPPLSWLEDDQKLQFKRQAQLSHYTLGEVLWSSRRPGSQQLLLAGKVRLLQEPGSSLLQPGKSVMLKPGDWFGDSLELAGRWKARAASREVKIVSWPEQVWQQANCPELRDFWADLRWRYQPLDPKLPHPVSGYPYEFNLNTVAACLSMSAQSLQAPISLKQVWRYVRGQTPRDIVEAAEKIGLQLLHIQTG